MQETRVSQIRGPDLKARCRGGGGQKIILGSDYGITTLTSVLLSELGSWRVTAVGQAPSSEGSILLAAVQKKGWQYTMATLISVLLSRAGHPKSDSCWQRLQLWMQHDRSKGGHTIPCATLGGGSAFRPGLLASSLCSPDNQLWRQPRNFEFGWGPTHERTDRKIVKLENISILPTVPY